MANWQYITREIKVNEEMALGSTLQSWLSKHNSSLKHEKRNVLLHQDTDTNF